MRWFKYKVARIACGVCVVAAVCALVFSGAGCIANTSAALTRETIWDYQAASSSETAGGINGSQEVIGDGTLLATAENILHTDSGTYLRNEVLLSFDGTVGEVQLRERLAGVGLAVTNVALVSKALDNNEVLVCITYGNNEDPAAVCERLAATDFISSAQPNHVYSLSDFTDSELSEITDSEDALSSEEAAYEIASEDDEAQNQLSATTINDTNRSKQWQLDCVKAYDAWDSVKASGNVTVVTIDSGVDGDHPDLVDNLLLDSAKNTFRETTGKDAVEDEVGHGTHVAGIIAATANNNKGVAGITYNANVLPLKVCFDSSGSMTDDDIIEAIDYAISLKKSATTAALANIRVINMSLGGGNENKEFESAINRAYAAGITVVAAAGNDDVGTIDLPAAYDHVIAVTAAKKKRNGTYVADTWDVAGSYFGNSTYSNYGDEADLCAPGTDVYSTTVTWTSKGGTKTKTSGYGTMSGTSMATPCVSAVAALVYACNLNFTPDQVESILEDTAVDYGTKGWDKYYGYGLVNALAAVEKALSASRTDIAGATIASIASQTYTGSALTPAVTVTYGGATLTAGTDYTIAYSNNTNAGTATVTVTGIGSYRGTKTTNFTIAKANVNMSGVTFADQTVDYDGAAHSIYVSGSLPSGVSVSYTNNNKTEAGTHTVTANFTLSSALSKNYNVPTSMTATLTIVDNRIDIANTTATVAGTFTYSGSAFTPSVSVTYQSKSLTAGTDYTVAYTNNIDAGTATATLTGKGNFKGTKTANFTIDKADLNMSGVTFTGQTVDYDGKSHSLAISGSLPNGVSVSYTNNNKTEAGTHTVTANFTLSSTLSKNYNVPVSMTATLTIVDNRIDIANASATVSGTFTYSGSALTPSVSVTYQSKSLTAGTDYTVAYTNNIDAGTATATLTGKGNYKGTKTANFTIDKADLNMSGVTFADQTVTYDGASHSLAISGSLPNGVSVNYTNNNKTEVGVHTVTASFTLNSTLSKNYNVPANKTATLTINQADIANASATVSGSFTYSGSAFTPSVSVTYQSKSLTAGTDYTVAYANNTNAGTATATLTGKGNYKGTKTANFTIDKADLNMSGVTFADQTVAYDGVSHSIYVSGSLPNGVSVSYTNNGKTAAGSHTVTASFSLSTELSKNYNVPANKTATLTIGQLDIANASATVSGSFTYKGSAWTPDVTVTYGSKALTAGTDYTVAYTNNTNAGTATATVSGKGNYKGTKTANFTIDKADLNMSDVTFADQTVTYDGASHSLAISGSLPNGVSVNYTNNNKTEVGVHTVTASFTLNSTLSKNYNVPANKTATLTIKDKPYKIEISVSGISNFGEYAYVDGNAYKVTKNGTRISFYADSANAQVLTLYSYYNFGASDAHTVYPDHMYVWFLTLQEDNSYSAARQSALNDILIYEGSSIRVTGKKGIRLISGIPITMRNRLISGWNGYTLQEYGTVLEFDKNLSGAAVTLENTTHSGAAYRRGSLDTAFSQDANELMYTNVLVGFTTAQCVDDLSMRPYMKLSDSSGKIRIIYGGIVHRSIKYIAEQNKNAFAAGTDAYNFIWGIINGS